MGCDGGTIPKRSEIVKKRTRRPGNVRDPGAKNAERWTHCNICECFLEKPIVSGHYGHMFCKKCILEFLIEHKTKQTPRSYHMIEDKTPVLDNVHNSKDVKELKLHLNTDSDCSQASNSQEETVKAKFACPITGLTTNGKYKFFFSWKCGCVVSERAIKEVPNDNKCLVCQVPYKEFELVMLNPAVDTELEINQAKFLVRKLGHAIDEEKLLSKSSDSSNLADWGDEFDSWTPSSRSSKGSHRSRARPNGHGDGASTSKASPSSSNNPSTSAGGSSTSTGGPSTSGSHSKRSSREDGGSASTSSCKRKKW